jgi:acyl carrier protein
MYLLDPHKRPVPIGVPGEIYIGGPGLAHGYLNQPRLTEMCFYSDLSRNDMSTPLFRTGDLARYLPDGNIEYIGRLDERILINSVRVEPAEIISRIVEHNAIAQATVIARKDQSGDSRLIAYYSVKPDHNITVTAVRKHLRNHVPSDMVPHYLVEVDHFPLTIDGRINQEALRPPFEVADGANGRHVSPGTDTERRIAAIWQALLGIEQIGLYDNFFELGGHSFMSMKVIAQIKNEIGVQITPRSLLLNTLQQISVECDAGNKGDAESTMEKPIFSWPLAQRIIGKVKGKLSGSLH